MGCVCCLFLPCTMSSSPSPPVVLPLQKPTLLHCKFKLDLAATVDKGTLCELCHCKLPYIYLFVYFVFIYVINVTNACENIVHGKSDAAFHLGQETLQRLFRISANSLSIVLKVSLILQIQSIYLFIIILPGWLSVLSFNPLSLPQN